MAYYGEYRLSMTQGGRIALPKKVRDELGNTQLVITKGEGGCLFGYDVKSWEGRVQELLTLPLSERDTTENLAKRRVIFSSTIYLETDDQGRVVLPKNLRTFAIRSKKVVIAGVGDHFEIWDLNKWEEYINSTNS
ncbi:MAG: cell division/cell wall cluster transcriptional repressor MraZ [bacterium]|nr:cell division/cell wall cluster transcriptional repressor MraZ [bacterium]